VNARRGGPEASRRRRATVGRRLGGRAYGQEVTATPAADRTAPLPRAGRARALPVLVVLVVGAALVRPLVAGSLDAEVLQSWATIFVAISVQALPFLALGVVVSGAIAAYVPPSALARLLPGHPILAVPVAAAAGWLCRAVSAAPCRSRDGWSRAAWPRPRR
jgi:hypothetical protein